MIPQTFNVDLSDFYVNLNKADCMDFYDVTIACKFNEDQEEVIFKGNKLILSILSDFFCDVLQKDSTSTINLSGIEPATLQHILHYLHKGFVTLLTEGEVCAFLRTAEFLKVHGLKSLLANITDSTDPTQLVPQEEFATEVTEEVPEEHSVEEASLAASEKLMDQEIVPEEATALNSESVMESEKTPEKASVEVAEADMEEVSEAAAVLDKDTVSAPEAEETQGDVPTQLADPVDVAKVLGDLEMTPSITDDVPKEVEESALKIVEDGPAAENKVEEVILNEEDERGDESADDKALEDVSDDLSAEADTILLTEENDDSSTVEKDTEESVRHDDDEVSEAETEILDEVPDEPMDIEEPEIEDEVAEEEEVEIAASTPIKEDNKENPTKVHKVTKSQSAAARLLKEISNTLPVALGEILDKTQKHAIVEAIDDSGFASDTADDFLNVKVDSKAIQISIKMLDVAKMVKSKKSSTPKRFIKRRMQPRLRPRKLWNPWCLATTFNCKKCDFWAYRRQGLRQHKIRQGH